MCGNILVFAVFILFLYVYITFFQCVFFTIWTCVNVLVKFRDQNCFCNAILKDIIKVLYCFYYFWVRFYFVSTRLEVIVIVFLNSLPVMVDYQLSNMYIIMEGLVWTYEHYGNFAAFMVKLSESMTNNLSGVGSLPRRCSGRRKGI